MKACITFGKLCLVLAWVVCIANSCTPEEADDAPAPNPLDTLVVPKAFLDNIFTNQEMNAGEVMGKILKNGMRIYEGTNPPDVHDLVKQDSVGIKFVVEHDCIYDEKAPGNKDSAYGKYVEAIRIQKNRLNPAVARVDYYSLADPRYPRYPDSLDRGTGTGYASGDGNNFTIFYKVTDAVYDNIRYDALWILSGTVVRWPDLPRVQRITGVTKCLVMLDKRGTDAGDKKVANKGTVRIFRDNTLDRFQPEVKLSGLTPNEGPGGTRVIITGSGFGGTPGENTVRFDAARGTVQDATPTQLIVIAPTGPKGGTVAQVTVEAGDSISNPLPFTYGVRITDLDPDSATCCNSTPIVITGSGFSTTLSENTVRFRVGQTTVTGAATAATPTRLTVTAPARPQQTQYIRTTVQVSVRVGNQTSNELPFMYTPITIQ